MEESENKEFIGVDLNKRYLDIILPSKECSCRVIFKPDNQFYYLCMIAMCLLEYKSSGFAGVHIPSKMDTIKILDKYCYKTAKFDERLIGEKIYKYWKSDFDRLENRHRIIKNQDPKNSLAKIDGGIWKTLIKTEKKKVIIFNCSDVGVSPGNVSIVFDGVMEAEKAWANFLESIVDKPDKKASTRTIFEAIEKNVISDIDIHLRSGAGVNSVGPNNYTPLQTAVLCSNFDAVKLLANNESSPNYSCNNIEDTDFNYPPIIANDSDIKVNFKDELQLFENVNVRRGKYIVKLWSSNNHELYYSHLTPAKIAIMRNEINIFQYFTEQEKKYDRINEFMDSSFLLAAAWRLNDSLIEKLITVGGGDINITDAYENNALMVVLKRMTLKLGKHINYNKINTLKSRTSTSGWSDSSDDIYIKYYFNIDEFLNINNIVKKDNSEGLAGLKASLKMHAYRTFIEQMDDLKQSLVDQLKGYYNKRTTIRNICQLLINNKINLNHNDKSSYTILHYATMFGHKETVRDLVISGANVNADSKYKMTPLHFAAFLGNDEIVDCLIEYGADVDSENIFGMTPIHFAAMSGKYTTLDMLAKHTKNKYPRKDIIGRTVSHYLARYTRGFQEKSLQLTEEIFKDLSIVDDLGNTALHYGIWYSRGNLNEMLQKQKAIIYIINNTDLLLTRNKDNVNCYSLLYCKYNYYIARKILKRKLLGENIKKRDFEIGLKEKIFNLILYTKIKYDRNIIKKITINEAYNLESEGRETIDRALFMAK